MKRSYLLWGISSLILIVLIAGCVNFIKLSDLRTPTAKSAPDEQKARQLLEAMGKAHGISNWDSISTYSVRFSDTFFGFIGKSGNPFKSDSTYFQLDYIANSFDGRLQILHGEPKDQIWGVQSWQSYSQNPNQEVQFEKDKDITFWVPTYQYFVEFPLRIQQASAVAYAGESIIDGKQCEGILASWNNIEPQKEIDQYLIWIGKEDKRIVKVEYTIREMFKFLTGAAYFKDYKDYSGILLPSYMPVESNLAKDFIHKMRILDFTPNSLDSGLLRPNSTLSKMGDEKI